MDNIIRCEKNITTYGFYKYMLAEFWRIYKEDSNNPPIIDMRNTEYMNSSVVPVIMSFGDYLKRLYKRPIKIMLEEGKILINFLISSGFYEISIKLNIFQFDDTIFNGLKCEGLISSHKVSYTKKVYQDADKIEDLEQRRDYIYDCLYERSSAIYRNILSEVNKLPENVIDGTMRAIAEVETNAVVHSKSCSFTFVESDNYGTNISIADSGIGFEKSLRENDDFCKVMGLIDLEEIDTKMRNYKIIMNALNYSYKKNVDKRRDDLWTLKEIAINNNGIFKIQFGNTQVIFSSSRCKNCKKNNESGEFKCTKCLLDSYREDVYSPIKLYGISLQGVRIEIKMRRGDIK